MGYHNEHHDFPAIAWTRLPALRALAPEFYDTLPAHPSWPMVIVNFIRDPEVGIFARVKRHAKESTGGTTGSPGGARLGSRKEEQEEDEDRTLTD